MKTNTYLLLFVRIKFMSQTLLEIKIKTLSTHVPSNIISYFYLTTVESKGKVLAVFVCLYFD